VAGPQNRVALTLRQRDDFPAECAAAVHLTVARKSRGSPRALGAKSTHG